MPDRATPARRLAHWTAAETLLSLLPKQTPREGQGSPQDPRGWQDILRRRADLLSFTASDFGVSRAPSEGHAPVFIFLSVPKSCCKCGLLPFDRTQMLHGSNISPRAGKEQQRN